jgi:hypothetical protein
MREVKVKSWDELREEILHWIDENPERFTDTRMATLYGIDLVIDRMGSVFPGGMAEARHDTSRKTIAVPALIRTITVIDEGSAQ